MPTREQRSAPDTKGAQMEHVGVGGEGDGGEDRGASPADRRSGAYET